MLEIEQIKAAQAEVVHSLAHDIWPHTFRTILKSEQIEYMLGWMYNEQELADQINNGILFYVLREFNHPKGFIALEANYPDAGFLRIHKLYLLPEMQGRGHGRLLMQKAFDVAFDLDLHTMHLNVNRFNPAVEFYKHIGFSISAEEDISIGQGFLMEDFIMELSLRNRQ